MRKIALPNCVQPLAVVKPATPHQLRRILFQKRWSHISSASLTSADWPNFLERRRADSRYESNPDGLVAATLADLTSGVPGWVDNSEPGKPGWVIIWLSQS